MDPGVSRPHAGPSIEGVACTPAGGDRAGINIAPIMPDITDTRANLESVIAAARDHVATHVFANVLFLKPSGQPEDLEGAPWANLIPAS